MKNLPPVQVLGEKAVTSQMYRNRETKLPLKAIPEVRGTKAMTNGNNKSTKKHQESYSRNTLLWPLCRCSVALQVHIDIFSNVSNSAWASRTVRMSNLPGVFSAKSSWSDPTDAGKRVMGAFLMLFIGWVLFELTMMLELKHLTGDKRNRHKDYSAGKGSLKTQYKESIFHTLSN